ncbi:hypothetical protein HMPREF9412_3686 [Paenibacillus sp. HGF5]|nr:hypothetical protein HMPREF9412_3686 [Paenibacillus sp. HGF5]
MDYNLFPPGIYDLQNIYDTWTRTNTNEGAAAAAPLAFLPIDPLS